jgi:tetratricopeptide (TPR) repeat protein
VLRTPIRFVFAVAVVSAMATMTVQVSAQEPAAQAGAKNWKDRGEYDLYDSILKDTTPQTRLDKLNQWKDKYAQSDFADQRRALYLDTYVKLGKVAEALGAAKEILAADPKDFNGLYYTMLLTPQLPPPVTADALDAASKAANSLLNGGIEAQFAAAKKPPAVTDDAWKQARTAVEAEAHKDLGWVSMQQKQNEQAEGEFQKALTLNPADSNVAYWMGTVIAGEKKAEKQSLAIYYFARAAAYDGQGALNPGGRKQVMDYIKNFYSKFHGSAEGFDVLIAQAKASAMPPADFHIVSVAEVEKARMEKDEKMKQENPALAIWLSVKSSLTAADGQTYFASNMKDTLVPGLSGKVVSMEPAVRPKTVVIAIEDGTTPDATLQFDAPLPGKVEPGTVLTFDGSPVSYTATPYMVTFKVEKDHLKGWTGTAPAPVRRPVRK